MMSLFNNWLTKFLRKKKQLTSNGFTEPVCVCSKVYNRIEH